MSGRTGRVENGEYWIRCPYCGDSASDPDKAHFSINLKTGMYHCHRCRAGGRLTLKQMMHLGSGVDFTGEGKKSDVPEEYPDLLPGAANARSSALPRQHTGDWDAFYLYDWDGIEQLWDQTGLLLRKPGEHQIIGGGGVAWPYAPSPLISDPTNPLRIVEGPYDVLQDQDVCLSGLISTNPLKRFFGHYVILCPDGDVWTKLDLFKPFLKTVEKLLTQQPGLPYLVGVEFIPDGKDPDETPVQSREFLRPHELWELIRRVRG